VVDDEESSTVTDDTETMKADDGEDDAVSTTGTELLIKTPEKLEKSGEIGTEFLLGDVGREASAAKDSVPSLTVVGTTRRRKSRVDGDRLHENGPGREMSDITADALSIQPTGYTLETAHVRFSPIGRGTDVNSWDRLSSGHCKVFQFLTGHDMDRCRSLFLRSCDIVVLFSSPV